MKTLHTVLAAVFLWLSVVPVSGASRVAVHEILLSNPLPVYKELFADSIRIDESLRADYAACERPRPRAGLKVQWFGGVDMELARAASKGDRFTLPRVDNSTPALIYAYFYLFTSRYQEIKLHVDCPSPCAVYVDGAEAARRTSPAGRGEHAIEAAEKLPRGKHLVTMAIMAQPGSSYPSELEIALTPKYDDTIEVGTDPVDELYRYDYIRRLKSVSGLAVSPDGKTAAVVIRKRKNGGEPGGGHIELYDIEKKRMTAMISMDNSARSPVFSPDSRSLAFLSSSKSGVTVWMMDLASGKKEALLREAKGVGNLTFSPDGKRLYFLSSKKAGKSSEKYVKYENLRDKLTDWNTRRTMTELNIATGSTRELLATGDYAVGDFALSPDGTKIAYARMVPLERRPYFKTEIWIQDARTLEGRKAAELRTGFENSPLNLAFSPRGDRLAFTSAPDSVSDLAPYEHNIYDSDLFLLDMASGNVRKLTAGFTPSVVERAGSRSVVWSRADGSIYFLALDRSRRKVFRVDPDDKRNEGLRIEEVKGGSLNTDYFSNFSRRGIFLTVESSFIEPPAVFVHKSGRKRIEMLTRPDEALFENIALGDVERFDFVDDSGWKIDGWILKPVGFDPNAKYPLIVYYYGGVAPRLEKFTFAYHWLNANGYVVYVLNPSGAYGAGEEFADLHVNDWGTLASQDIIQGVKKLLAAKPYLDENKVGAYGGSYGGFITMDLTTKTDIFAAVCSMYGISDITSYWGGGTWGFTYGDMALARSYPWKNREIFVDKSPIYNADKIHTPILFLHGAADVNVPPEESHELFTALKILGRDAVLVEFAGEDHGIAGSTKNLVDHREIMLEWFDKYLKGEPEAWNDRWAIDED